MYGWLAIRRYIARTEYTAIAGGELQKDQLELVVTHSDAGCIVLEIEVGRRMSGHSGPTWYESESRKRKQRSVKAKRGRKQADGDV